MASISVRKLAILALLDAPDAEGRVHAPIAGTTRLQKLLFLVREQLPRVSGDRLVRVDFEFEAYKFGPADLRLYQDLEFLISLEHIAKSSETNGDLLDRPGPEESTERALSFAYLMGDEDDAGLLAEAEEELEEYRITASGERLLAVLVGQASGKGRELCDRVLAASRDVKQTYSTWPLQRLLRYVYSEHPDMTTSSEIRERVLGR